MVPPPGRIVTLNNTGASPDVPQATCAAGLLGADDPEDIVQEAFARLLYARANIWPVT
jgi:hypothetical protein